MWEGIWWELTITLLTIMLTSTLLCGQIFHLETDFPALPTCHADGMACILYSSNRDVEKLPGGGSYWMIQKAVPCTEAVIYGRWLDTHHGCYVFPSFQLRRSVIWPECWRAEEMCMRGQTTGWVPFILHLPARRVWVISLLARGRQAHAYSPFGQFPDTKMVLVSVTVIGERW